MDILELLLSQGEKEEALDAMVIISELEAELDKVDAKLEQAQAENKRLREAARYTVNAWNAGNFDGTDDGIEALASTLRDIEGGEKGR